MDWLGIAARLAALVVAVAVVGAAWRLAAVALADAGGLATAALVAAAVVVAVLAGARTWRLATPYW